MSLPSLNNQACTIHVSPFVETPGRVVRGQRFVWQFPEAVEDAFLCADDFVISCTQKALQCPVARRISVAAAKLLGLVTTIEVGFMFPPFLLLMRNFDDEAILATYIMFSMALLTQVPKRFIWRSRPFAAGRALEVKKIDTSSFPSRAVVAAVVYGGFFSLVFAPEGSVNALNAGVYPWCWAIIALFAVATSWSRVLLGVHYPSDCLCGGLLGLVVHGLGTTLANLHCHSCHSSHGSTHDGITSPHVVLAVGVVLGALLVAGMAMPPLTFWAKCTHAFSLLMPSLIFLLAFRCPRLSGSRDVIDADPPYVATGMIAVSITTAVTGAGLALQHVKKLRFLPVQLTLFACVFVSLLVAFILARCEKM